MCHFVRIGSSDCLFYTCLNQTLFGEYHSALTKRKKQWWSAVPAILRLRTIYTQSYILTYINRKTN